MGNPINKLMEDYGISWLDFSREIGNIVDKLDSTRVITQTNITKENSEFGGYQYRFFGGYIDMPRVIPLGEFSLRMKVSLTTNNAIGSTYAFLLDQRGWNNAGSGWAMALSNDRGSRNIHLAQYNSQTLRTTAQFDLTVDRWYDLLISYSGDSLNVYFLGEGQEPIVSSKSNQDVAEAQANLNLKLGVQHGNTDPCKYRLAGFEVYSKALSPRDFARGFVAYEALDGKVYVPYDNNTVRILPSGSDVHVREFGYPIQELDEYRGIDLDVETDVVNLVAKEAIPIDTYKVYEITLPSDFTALEGNTSNRYLVYHGGSYKYFSPTGGWISIGTHITTENIEETVMQDLSTVSTDAWSVLPGAKTLYIISDCTCDDIISINATIEPFNLADKLGSNCKVIYINNGEGEFVEFSVDSTPTPVDDILKESNLVMESLTGESVAVRTETDEVSVYNKFGDSVTVGKIHNNSSDELYPIVTANWTPLDELEDPDLVFNSKDIGLPDNLGIYVDAEYLPKTTLYSTELNVTPLHLKKIVAMVSLRHPETEFRFAITKDNRTWHSKKGNVVNMFASAKEVHDKGMTIEEFGALTEDYLKTITNLGYVVTVGIKNSTLSYHKEGLDFIEVTQDLPYDTLLVSPFDICILNSEVELNLNFLGSVLQGSLDDPDKGMLKYRVTLNGEKYYPNDEDKEWSDFYQADHNVFIQLSSGEVVIGGENTLIIEVEDYFGNTYSQTYVFEGEYPGLLFKDPSNGYYTTDIGEIIKYLEVGVLQQGQTSPQFEIHLVNNNPFMIEQTELVGTANSSGLTIEFSKNGMPFMPERTLTWEEVIGYKEIKPFFIRLVADKNAEITQNGLFKITAEAKMVE